MKPPIYQLSSNSEIGVLTDGNVTLSIPSAYTHPSTHPASMITGLATVATSGKYSDLSGRPSLATVATSGSYNDLSNKPSIPSSPKAYVTTTYRSGASWYRKWSDGFIEQGGKITNTSAGTDTVTYPISFSSIVLYAGCSSIRSGSGSEGNDYVSNVSLTKCSFRHEKGSGAYWYVRGF